MFDKLDAPWRYVLSALIFPTFFQEQFLRFAWGGQDDLLIALFKRIFILLPVVAILAASWLSIVCLLSVVVRHKRRQYVSTLLVTWWDLGRAIFSFWGGFFKFCFYLVGWIFALIRVIIVGLWAAIQDILFAPFRAIKGVSDIASKPGVPWIAVWLTIVWCALEAFIFTFVMTNLVIDTLSGLTGIELDVGTVQFFLYFTLLGFILGSYAIVASLEQAVKSKDIKQIVFIFIVEIVALLVEVMFLYREFVDALVPWFAQHAGEDFRMSAFTLIFIASLVWAGVRAMTWFLFAGAGTPTIMAIIQRTGLSVKGASPFSFKKKDHFIYVRAALEKIQNDIDWCHAKGEEILSAFILPPLQIVAAVINFCTMLVSAKHLFELPFKSYRDMLHADELIRRVRQSDD